MSTRLASPFLHRISYETTFIDLYRTRHPRFGRPLIMSKYANMAGYTFVCVPFQEERAFSIATQHITGLPCSRQYGVGVLLYLTVVKYNVALGVR